MKLRNIISTIHMPYRKVMYVVAACGSIFLYVVDWIPFSLYFLRYVSVSILLAVALYFSFWVYKAGYRKQALLMTIVGVALFAMSIVIYKWAYDGLYAIGYR